MQTLIIVCAMIVAGLAPFMSVYTPSDAAIFDNSQNDAADAEDDVGSDDTAESNDSHSPQA